MESVSMPAQLLDLPMQDPSLEANATAVINSTNVPRQKQVFSETAI